MTLLLDANLSPRLVALIDDLFPGSGHVFGVGLGPDDGLIWSFARDNDFTILSKDSDFYRFSVMSGAPPKVVWLRVGNDGTEAVAQLIRDRAADILAFEATATEALLILAKR